MPFRFPARVFDAIARRLGYVPRAEMVAALAAKDRIEQSLLHKTRGLQQQVSLRNRLENEVQFLRELELARASGNSGVQQAVDRIDAIASNLLGFMQSVWPEAHDLELPGQETEETKEVAAV